MAADPAPIFRFRVTVPISQPNSAPWHFIPTRIHGVLDYLVGLLLIVLPFLPGFPRVGKNAAAMWLPVALDAGALVYSLVTNYELGLLRLLPMPMHLAFDFLSGVLLAASPWLFGFQHQIYLPQLILGLFEIGAALFTRTRPFTRSAAVTGRLPTVLF